MKEKRNYILPISDWDVAHFPVLMHFFSSFPPFNSLLYKFFTRDMDFHNIISTNGSKYLKHEFKQTTEEELFHCIYFVFNTKTSQVLVSGLFFSTPPKTYGNDCVNTSSIFNKDTLILKWYCKNTAWRESIFSEQSSYCSRLLCYLNVLNLNDWMSN